MFFFQYKLFYVEMRKLLAYFLVNLFLLHVSLASNFLDIQFKLPDLTIDYLTKSGYAHLEAFKTHINNEILDEKKVSDFSKLKWVSYGYPVLVDQNRESNDNSFVSNSVDRRSYNLSNLFHFTPEGFHIFVEMLTKEQRELFAREAQLKYKISIEPRQIVRLIPEVFSCNLGIFDESKNEKIFFKGHARKRIILEKRIEMMRTSNGNDDFVFDCEFETIGKKIKTNILKITFEQINDLELINKIFGDDKEAVYLTRKQIKNLSNSIYSKLKIEEIYEITEHQFSEKFVSNLIELVADSSIKKVDFDTALSSLSKYSIDVGKDIRPDIIRNEISSKLRIEKLGENNHIIVNKQDNESENSKSEDNQKVGLSADFDWFDVQASGDFVKRREKDWQKYSSTLDDQLKELNRFSQENIEYKFEGEKIIPKSLKVTLFKKSKFKNTLKFNRIFTLYNDAEFKRKFTLDVKNSLVLSSFMHDRNKIYPFQKGMIQIVDSTVLKNYFSSEGKGLDEYVGWHICNGKSNTPDLTGKFVVGFDKNRKDYSSVGNVGGNDFVKLTTEQMPMHTHYDLGHSHYLDLRSGESGHHKHEYRDTYWSEGKWWHNRNGDLYSDNPDAIGSKHNDMDNMGWDKLRFTDTEGAHSHFVVGNSNISNAYLTYTGENKQFENRPSYYVVAFIIFQGII